MGSSAPPGQVQDTSLKAQFPGFVKAAKQITYNQQHGLDLKTPMPAPAAAIATPGTAPADPAADIANQKPGANKRGRGGRTASTLLGNANSDKLGG